MSKQVRQTLIKAFPFALLFLCVNCIEAQTNKTELKLQESVREKVIAGQTKKFSFRLDKEKFARVMIRRLDAAIKIRLYDFNDRLIDEGEPVRKGLDERFCVIAESSGEYRIEIELTEKDSNEAEFIIELEALRVASASDRELSRAEKLFSEGDALRGVRQAESLRNSLAKYEEAFVLFSKTDEKARQAETLRNLGYVNRLLGEFLKTIDYYERAIPLFREMGDRHSEGELMVQKAEALFATGEYKKALTLCEEALSIFREIGDKENEISTAQNVAVIYASIGESRKALEFFKGALPAIEATGNKLTLATAYSNIASIYDDLGEVQESLSYYTKALSIRREIKDTRGQIKTLINVSSVYNAIGEIQKALESLNEAIELSRQVGDKNTEATALGNLGANYDELGDSERATDFFKKAQAIHRETGNKKGEAYSLIQIGTVVARSGNPKDGLSSLLNALSMMRELGDKQGEAQATIRTGEIYDLLGDKTKAHEHFTQALSLLKTLGDKIWQTYVLEKLGQLSFSKGEKEKSAEYYKQALTLARSIYAKRNEASILFGLSQIEKEKSNFEKARENLESAIEITESVRSIIARSDLRATLLSSTQNRYENYISLLIELHKREPKKGFDLLALQASERARARGFLEALQETQKNIRQGVSLDLLEKEKLLQQSINAKENYRTQLSLTNASQGKIAEANKEIQTLINQYRETLAQIRTQSPRYASLTQPRILSASEIQKEVLNSETILLEYSLGDERSFLFLVTQNSLSIYELPSRPKIESSARRLYEAMTARARIVENETPAQRQRRIQKADDDFKLASRELSEMLSISKIEETKAKRLLIVAGGALQYIPFAMLSSSKFQVSDSKSEERAESYVPLIGDYEIVNLPSASVISVLREGDKRTPAPKSVAIFADPVFGASDVRIQSQTKNGNDKSQENERTNNLVRLRFSRQEADYISSLISRQERFLALDFGANKTAVQSDELSKYRIIHFATHGFLDSSNTELSGLVFSRFDEKGKSVEGFLRLYEVYNLKLNADLVVLSACQTALGKEIRGEGIIGLTRGFMYAGAPTVSASLWRVDDRATAELMKRFYQAMLKDKMRPSSALRSAQLSLMKEARWSAPYYWAAFILQGEWR